MLKNDFYFVENLQEANELSWIFTIRWNLKHIIYSAHFPNHPITPGACILEMTKELISEKTGKKLFIKQVKNIKFFASIDPLQYEKVNLNIVLQEIDQNTFGAKIEVYYDQNVFTKISMQLSTKL